MSNFKRFYEEVIITDPKIFNEEWDKCLERYNKRCKIENTDQITEYLKIKKEKNINKKEEKTEQKQELNDNIMNNNKNIYNINVYLRKKNINI